MRGYSQNIKPASAAIAAVLAFTSTYSSAQEAPAIAPPPASEVIEPPVASPGAPNFAPAEPVVQQTPSVEERLAASIAASESEQAAPPLATSAPQPRQRTASRDAAPAPVPVAPVAVRSTAPAAPAVTPLAKPEVAAPAPLPAATVQQTASEATPVATDRAIYWAMGGSAVILLGLGGTALARRRRRRAEDGPAIPPAIQAAPAPFEHAPVPARTPTAAPAPAMASVPATTLEAMVAAPPSAENPFRTHKKRLARARFLIAQREGHAPLPARVAAQAAVSEPVLPRMETQTVYHFGSGQPRRSGFKPQTN